VERRPRWKSERSSSRPGLALVEVAKLYYFESDRDRLFRRMARPRLERPEALSKAAVLAEAAAEKQNKMTDH
jgi:hypothetical protein